MAKKFVFKDNNLKLDIAGNIFELDTTDVELIRRIQEFSREAQQIAQAMTEKDDYAEALEDTIRFCLDTIDNILGEGSSEKIFTGRKVGLLDCLDVIQFITAEVNEDRASRFQVYSPNRAQRRAQK